MQWVPEAIATCCRRWIVNTLAGIGRCGYCGERPRITGPVEESDG